MRRASTLVTPWYFSSRPRISSAGAVRATLRKRFHTSGVQITLTRPVSSSRLMKITPFDVDGCCRCVTTPAIVDHRAVGQRAQRLPR